MSLWSERERERESLTVVMMTVAEVLESMSKFESLYRSDFNLGIPVAKTISSRDKHIGVSHSS
jgi:hypothetical protein